MDEKKLVNDCLNNFGDDKQVDKAIEETTEFLLELIRIKNGISTPRKLAGEMADLLLCPVAQMTELMNRRTKGQFSKMVEIEKQYKMSRTELMMESHLMEESKKVK